MNIILCYFNVKVKNISPTEISGSFNESLVDKLVGSRKFTVLDRQYMDQTLGEKSLALKNPTISVAEIARLGNQLVADYVVVGRIENLEYRIRSIYFKFLKKKFRTPERFPMNSTEVLPKVRSESHCASCHFPSE